MTSFNLRVNVSSLSVPAFTAAAAAGDTHSISSYLKGMISKILSQFFMFNCKLERRFEKCYNNKAADVVAELNIINK